MNLIITKLNESYLRIDTEKSILYELSGYFSFKAPNANFDKRVKLKIWDGFIRLFNIKTRSLPYGLIEELIKFCDKNKYEYELRKVNDVIVKQNINKNELKKYIDSLNIYSKGEKLEIRDYQFDAVYEALNYKKRLILSSTGSGKSCSIYILIRYIIDHGLNKGVLIVPRLGLIDQMYNDFIDYSSHNKWNVDEHCHKIFSGQEKTVDKSLYISTFQSLAYIKDIDYFLQFNFVLVDEAHSVQSDSFNKILIPCINSQFKIGFTGSLSDSKTDEKCIIGLLGPTIKVSNTKDLIDRKILSALNIKCILLKYPLEVTKDLYKIKFIGKNKILKMTYEDEVKFIISNVKRNNFIKKLALNLKGNTLILFNRVEDHGKLIYELIKGSKHSETRKVFFIHGKVDTDVRNEIREIVENEKNAIIVASMGTFSTGINIINLHNIINAFNNKSRIGILQSIGRGLRRSDEKTKINVYDIIDDLSYKKYSNFTLEHFIQRVKFYDEEKFDYYIHKYDLYKK